MRLLASSDILDLWERGSHLHPLDQCLLALSVALPEESSKALADWPLGRRDRALVELCWSWFGPLLRGWVACRSCGEKLEFQIDGRALLAQDEPNPDPIVVSGRSFRLPTSRDLVWAARESDPRQAAIRLLENCLLDAGETLARSDLVWTDKDLDEVGEKMALADPMAETLLTLDCPRCGNQWQETLDLAAFVWAEIGARAKRLLREVHALGSAYGWTEKEILSLSEPRRAFYLGMVEA